MSPTEALSRGWPIWAMAAGQFFGYACQFYAFTALVPHWHAELGWSKSMLAMGPMLAMLVAASLAPVVGRFVDRGQGPELMVCGTLIGAAALAGMSMVTAPWQWFALWVLSGLGQIAAQYEVCFAFLIRRLGGDARRAIIRVTLMTGFASLLSIPAYTALAELFDWRVAMRIAAIVMLCVVLPANFAGAAAIRRGAPSPAISALSKGPANTPKERRRTRRLLAISFALCSLGHWMVAHLLVALLTARGYTLGQAVLAAALMGPAQVLGRLLLMLSEARISNVRAILGSLLAMICATFVLLGAGAGYGLVMAYVLVQGAAMGMAAILRPVLIEEVLGRDNYGANAGAIQLPTMTAGALSPLLGAAVLEGMGATTLILISFGLLVFSASALLALRRRRF